MQSKLNAKKTKLNNRRGRQYTAMSSAVTVLLIAVVLLFNIGFYALANHFVWYADMTGQQVYSLSDAAAALLDDVEDEVNIYFAVEPDKISDESPYLFYVYQTALQMEAKYKNIHVECVDIIKNPGFFKSYYATAAQDIRTTSVIVESGTEFRLFYIDSFFVFDEEYKNIWAYQGEYRIVSAILSMTADEMPAVNFTTAHGETVGDDAAALIELFSDAGYTVKTVDLTREEIDADARIVIVNNPLYDFAGMEGEVNEIDKLDAFLDTYGCLMVFVSPEKAGRLTNLSELLAEWGVAFTPDTYLRDSGNSLSTDGRTLVGDYGKNTLGASLYTDISGLDTMPKTIFRNAMPLQLLWEKDDALEGTKEISPVLYSYDSAEAICDGKTADRGALPLMTISREQRIVDNETYYSYVLVSGSADYTAAEYLRSNTYANRDILYSAMRITGRERILADINYKVLDKTDMDITTAQANRWTVALTVTLPVIIGAAGVCVWIRRRNG